MLSYSAHSRSQGKRLTETSRVQEFWFWLIRTEIKFRKSGSGSDFLKPSSGRPLYMPGQGSDLLCLGQRVITGKIRILIID